MKRILSLTLALLMLAATACGGEGGEVTDTTTAPEAEATTAPEEEISGREAVESSLPDGLDFEGDTVTILSRSEAAYLAEFSASEQNGEIINDTIFNRNQYVCETLNCGLELISRDGAYGQHTTFASTVVNEVMAGDDSYDIVSFYAYAAPLLTSQGAMMNLHDVENLDLSKPWWHKDFAEKAEVYGKLYAIAGDICLTTVTKRGALFFNQRLVDEYVDENLYELVDSNKWTIEGFDNLSRDLYVDVNGNTEKDEGDIFGWYPNGADQLTTGCHFIYTTRTEDGGYEWTMMNEKNIDIISHAASIYQAPGSFNGVKDANLCFKNGQFIFFPGTMGFAEQLRDMKDDYGILPYPKYDESQENYYSVAGDSYSQIMIPTTCKDDALVGAFLELAGEYSYKKLTPAYFETAMKGKYLRDNDSARMFDIIMEGAYYDFAVINTSVLGDPVFIMRGSLLEKDGYFASYYASRESELEKKLDNLLGNFQNT